MVNQDILNYLLEGRKRGFGLALLKRKLLEGGFDAADIDEAIMALPIEKMESKPLPASARPSMERQPLQAQPASSSQEKLSFFRKIGYAITKPRALFEHTGQESVGRTLLFHETLLIIPFALFVLMAFVLVSMLATLTPSALQALLLIFSTTAHSIILGIFAITSFVITPLLVLLIAGITHLFVILLKGKGYAGTYRALVYGTIPGFVFSPVFMFVSFLPFGSFVGFVLALALFVWSLIITIKALAHYHSFSGLKSFFALFLGTLFSTMLCIAVILALAMVAGISTLPFSMP